ncbi:MAG: glycosyltransferase [Candidatus Omnitrophica bacterium]|nr:glycosyltransferase [Candidatus Omnitrophota bacterium]
MKIAHLISNYFPNIGGAQACVHQVANRTVDKGHSAVVITPTPGDGRDDDYNYEILRVNPLINRFLFINYHLGKIYLERMLDGIQKKYRFDLWQVTVGYPLGAASVDFFNRNGIPCVLRSAGEDIQMLPELNYGYRLNKAIDARVRDNYRKFSALVTAGDSTKNDYLSIGVPEGKISILPNGVDYAKFRTEIDRRAVRDELGIKEDEKLILTVGRNHPKKGYRHIPQIIKKLLAEGLRFKWLLAGKDCEVIRSLAETEGHGGHLIVRELAPGYSKNGDPQIPNEKLIEYYRASDIFVFPTYIELFAKVIIEAMAAGLPIVTTNAPGVDSLIRNNENGLICKAADAGCMAVSVSRLFSDKALADRLGKNALLEAKNYDWSRISDGYLDLYENAMKSGPKVKIAHIITDLDIGGAEMMLLRMLRNFKDSKYEHIVISLHPEKNSLKDEIEQEALKVYPLDMSIINFPVSFMRLVGILKREKPLIVHNYLFHADILGRIAAKLARVPKVISSIRNENIGGRARELLLGMTDFSVDRVTAVSRSVADSHLKKGTTKKRKIDVIYNGMELENYTGEGRSAARKSLDITENAFVIATVANLEPKKGHIFLLKALGELKRKGCGFKLLLAGSGKEEKRLKNEAMNMGLKDAVLFLGRSENISGLLAASDLFVLPSLWEGLPNALLEAMAAGLPVVATRVGGVPEAVVDGETGLLVEPGDVSKLAEALRKMMDDDELRKGMAGRAKAHAAKNFDIKNTVLKLDKLYNELLT